MKVASQKMANSEYRVVVGLGTTGLSCARFLLQRGLPFVVVDTRSEPPGLAEFRREMPDVELYTGDYPQELVAAAAELIVSPGVAMDANIVLQAVAAGVDVVGDIDLFMREATAPVVGITGSNAKSTVTELLGQMARDAHLNVGVGGNLGTPALELLAPERQLYVLELSSFQLERAHRLGLDVATVLNVSADHLDRHGTLAHYRTAKHRIFSACKTAVVNRDDPLTVPLLGTDVNVVSWRLAEPESGGFGLRQQSTIEYLSRGNELLMPVTELSLVGRHNVANALAAMALGHCAGLSMEDMLATLRTFKGLPHRCELVTDIAGVRYVNDSKGTNVGATEAALYGLGGANNVLLIAGGQGKGADFTQLQQAVERHCKLLILVGEDAPLLEQALRSSAPVVRVSSLDEAVAAAAKQAVKGDVVLLSPACASFDMFTGYVERGNVFAARVRALAEEQQ
ncbi:UDP-N-acetylmuramoylalanine--D-glutamate ligase [Halioglobus japonicus]|nr:UDP-N-acetylmuramoylalanine--D-glutamate ligase [Halioglobus japonicus]